MSEPIEFYFDFSSPYGYLMGEKIDALAERFQRRVKWRPILLGVIFPAVGGRPPVEGGGLLQERPQPGIERLAAQPFVQFAQHGRRLVVDDRAVRRFGIGQVLHHHGQVLAGAPVIISIRHQAFHMTRYLIHPQGHII